MRRALSAFWESRRVTIGISSPRRQTDRHPASLPRAMVPPRRPPLQAGRPLLSACYNFPRRRTRGEACVAAKYLYARRGGREA